MRTRRGRYCGKGIEAGIVGDEQIRMSLAVEIASHGLSGVVIQAGTASSLGFSRRAPRVCLETRS